MFVSLLAGRPHTGQVVSTHSGMFTSGLSPVPDGSYFVTWLSPVPDGSYFVTSGRVRGSWSSGTGTVPQCSQCTRGIGSPQ